MSTLPHVHTYSWIVLLKHRRISSVYTGSGSRTTATTYKDIHFCYCYWLWLEAFTIAPLRTTLDVSRVLQILFRLLLFLRYFSNIFLVQFFIFKNFDKVNAHLVYSASATIFQYICSETPIFLYMRIVCQHASSTRQLILQTNVLCQRRWATIIFITLWDFLMFYQIFLSPQVKRWAIMVCTSCRET